MVRDILHKILNTQYPITITHQFIIGNRKVYHLPSSRFIEAVVKPALFHLAKTASHRRFIFVVSF
jgi:hypothetical protein